MKLAAPPRRAIGPSYVCSPRRWGSAEGVDDEAVQPKGRAPAPRSPVTVVVVNDVELVVRGLDAMLAPYSHRVRVVAADAGHGSSPRADVALVDTFADVGGALERGERMRSEGRAGHVVIYTWDPASVMADSDRRHLSGVIGKTARAGQLVDGIERAAAGERVVVVGRRLGAATAWRPDPSQPLSEREAEVLTLVAEGLTNRQVGEALFISAETVKTLLRRASDKLGARNRAHAAAWAALHGLVRVDPGRRSSVARPLGRQAM